MNVKGSHYSVAFDSASLIEISNQTAKDIKLISNMINAEPIICYRGFSGISFATAISTQYYSLFNQSILQAYVRKEHEKSHGENVENNFSIFLGTYFLIFIDDFICSGTSFNETIQATLEEIKLFNSDTLELYPLVFTMNQFKTTCPRIGSKLLIDFEENSLSNFIIDKHTYSQFPSMPINRFLTKSVEKLGKLTLISCCEENSEYVYQYYLLDSKDILKTNVNYFNSNHFVFY